MNDKFVNLHMHSEYSLLDGYGHPEWFVKRAAELGQTAIAITDHGNISGHKRWYDACKKYGLKPILGIEAYLVGDAKEKTVRERSHITLLARNLEGYRNLTKLVSMSYAEGFYYKPRIDWEMLKNHNRGIIATSSCPSGWLGQMIEKNPNIEYLDITTELARQAAIFEPGSYFVELQPWTYKQGRLMAMKVYDAAVQAGYPIVLTMDCHYPKAEDAFKQDVMLCIQNNTQFNAPGRMKFDQEDFYLKSGQQMKEDWEKAFPLLPFRQEMIDNTAEIADMVDFEFPTARPIEFPLTGAYKGADKVQLFKNMCLAGLKERGLWTKKEYKERLKREFDLIVEKGYVDYFLVVSDLVNWAKQKGILVGPARGSSCGSLICYLTHITEIDPLPYHLLFERFIDINRTDLPDIDVDFEDERRDEVKEYLKSKYGADHVASPVTFGTFKGRLCVQDIGRVFEDKIPDAVIQEVKKLIVQRSGGDSRFGFTVEDTFVNFDNAAAYLKQYPELDLAKYLEGQVRHMGVHASGTIVSNEPITNFAAFYRSSNDEKVISMDYDDASSIGLLKIDLLGLTTMTVLQRTLKLVKERHGKEIDLYKIPLDDEKVYHNFKAAKLFGVFQFDGQACMQVCKQVKPDNFEELYAINALSRPGPLHSGGTTNYVERKNGKQDIVHLHPIMEEITKDTYGVTIYQEQVMRIVKELGNFSWEDTSTIRKTMSKSVGVESFAKYGERFIAGAVKNGMKADVAEKLWKDICNFGSWAFNKSHSVAYTLVSYWCMWFKVYYPIEFYVSMLQCEKQEDKVRKVLKEFQADGFELLPVDINKSRNNFEIDGKGIRCGLTYVKGLGDGLSQVITDHQPYKNYIDFEERSKVKKMANVLLRIGAFRELEFTSVKKQQSLFGDHLIEKQSFDYKNPSVEDLREFCPLALQEKPINEWAPWIKKNLGKKPQTIKSLDDLTEMTEVVIIGNTDPKKYFNPKNKIEEAKSRGGVFEAKKGEEHLRPQDYDFLNFDLEDETDYVTVRISYKLYPEFKEMMWDCKPGECLMVTGVVNGAMRMVFANNVVNLTKMKKHMEQGVTLTDRELSIIKTIKDYESARTL